MACWLRVGVACGWTGSGMIKKTIDRWRWVISVREMLDRVPTPLAPWWHGPRPRSSQVRYPSMTAVGR